MCDPRARRRRAFEIALLFGVALGLVGCPRFQQQPNNKWGDKNFIKVGDRGKVYVHETGEGPAVLLIHGFAGAHDHWATIQPALTMAGFRVISVDLPGSGRSDKYPGDYTPAGLAKSLFDLLDLLGVEKAHVAGHSWGTSLALAMAMAQPQRVRSITLIGSWVYEDQLAPFIIWSRAPLLGEALFGLYLDAFLDERMALTFYDRDFHGAQPKTVEFARRQLKNPGFMAASLAAARAMRFAKMQTGYKKIKQRVLLIHGAHDPITRLPWARRLHGEIPDARLVQIDSACHMPQLEQPAKVLQAMVPFIQGLEPGQAPLPPAKPAPPSPPPNEASAASEASEAASQPLPPTAGEQGGQQ